MRRRTTTPQHSMEQSTPFGTATRRAVFLVLQLATAGSLAWLLQGECGTRRETTRTIPADVLPLEPMAHGAAPGAATPIEADIGTVRLKLTGTVAAVDGHGIANATVCLAPTNDRCCALGVRCTETDRSGYFVFDAGPAGDGQLVASANGYQPLSLSVSETVLDSPLRLVLQPGGALIRGSVVDASGGPVAGALVSAAQDEASPQAIAATDGNGAFSLTAPPGGSQLTARADGYSLVRQNVHAPQHDVRLVMVASSSLSGRVLMAGTEMPVEGVDVSVIDPNGLSGQSHRASTDQHGAFRIDALRGGGYSIVARSAAWRSDEHWLTLGVAEQQAMDIFVRPAVHLHGSVEVAGSPCSSGMATLDGPVSEYRLLDERGEVDFPGLPPGTYRAVVSCHGAVELTEELDLQVQTVRKWELSQGLTLSGRALSSSGAALDGAQVSVSPMGAAEGRPSVFCFSDAQGEFACSGLLPGEYSCELRSDSAEMSDPVRVTVDSSSGPRVVLRSYASATLRVTVKSGGDLQLDALSVIAQREGGPALIPRQEGSVFVFEQMALGTYQVTTDPEVPGTKLRIQLVGEDQIVEAVLGGFSPRALTGRVIDEEGHGVADAWVRALGGVTRGFVRPSAPVLTDAEGLFEIEGLLPGRYQLNVTSSRGDATVEDAVAGQNVTIPLRSYGSLSGVASTPGGALAASFTLAYGPVSVGAVNRVRGVDGRWSLPWLPPGTYRLRVDAPEGSADVTVDIPPGRETHVALELTSSNLNAVPN